MRLIVRIKKKKIKFLLVSNVFSLKNSVSTLYYYSKKEVVLIDCFLHVNFFSGYRFFVSILKKKINESLYIYKNFNFFFLRYMFLLNILKKYFYCKELQIYFFYLESYIKICRIDCFWHSLLRLIIYLKFLKIKHDKYNN